MIHVIRIISVAVCLFGGAMRTAAAAAANPDSTARLLTYVTAETATAVSLVTPKSLLSRDGHALLQFDQHASTHLLSLRSFALTQLWSGSGLPAREGHVLIHSTGYVARAASWSHEPTVYDSPIPVRVEFSPLPPSHERGPHR